MTQLASTVVTVTQVANSIPIKEILSNHVAKQRHNGYTVYGEYDSAKHTVIMVNTITSGDHHHHGLTHDERMRFALNSFSNQSMILLGKSLQHDRLC